MNELTPSALEAAERIVGDGPVVMANFLWFRDQPAYPAGFTTPKRDARSAYYEGYADAFRAIAGDLGLAPQLVYAGRRQHGLLAGPDDDWDDIVIVRYERFADLRRIVNSDAYAITANPHRLAGVAKWRFIATRG
jgi:hypothetical protein